MRVCIRLCTCVHACICELVDVELMDITEQLAELHQKEHMKVLFPAELQLPVLMSSG